MLEQDKREFAEIYRGVCATYGREASKEAMRIAWAALGQFSISQVRAAYTSHLVRSKYMPTPAEIIAAIYDSTPAMQRPGADEAWAMMPRDESDSVVWTTEMASAWAVASSLVNPLTVERPDWVAARMAFKDAYNRAVDNARAVGAPVRWEVCRGTRTDNLEDVLTEAIRLGRITDDDAMPLIAQLEHVRPMNRQLLLECATEASKDQAMEFVAKLKAMLQPEATSYDIDAIRAECEAKDRELAQQDVRKAG